MPLTPRKMPEAGAATDQAIQTIANKFPAI